MACYEVHLIHRSSDRKLVHKLADRCGLNLKRIFYYVGVRFLSFFMVYGLSSEFAYAIETIPFTKRCNQGILV